MRIAVFPKAYLHEMIVARTKNVFEWIEQAQSLGADGVELHVEFLWDRSAAAVRRVSDALAAAGFEMPMLCVSPDFTHPDASERSRQFDAQIEAMRIAAELGGAGAVCRVLSGQAHPSVSREQGLEWVSDAITRLLPVARELDIVLGLENHYKASTWEYPEFAQRPELFHALLEMIPDRTHFGVQYDPSNAIVAGVDSADFLETVVHRVVSMQASDRFLEAGTDLGSLRQADGTLGYSPALRHGVVGQGLNDYARIFTTLREAGYDGWISIEDGINGMEEMRASVEFLQRARDDYFSGSIAVSVSSLESARRHDRNDNS